MTSNRDMGVCVVGCGRAGMIHARNFARKVARARLVALVDPQESALREAQRELGAEAVFGDVGRALASAEVNVVVVASPPSTHRQTALAATEAGKHVLCEKPLAMTVADCDSMIQACAAARVKLQVGFMRRYDESYRAAKERLDGGEIGEVVLVKSVTRGPSAPQEWMFDLRRSNGPLSEVNSHDIDAARWFMGAEVEEVYALGGNFRCPQAAQTYPDFFDTVAMLCRFRNGKQGMIDGAFAVGYGYDCRLEVLGTRGALFVGRRAQDAVVSCTPERGVTRTFVKSWRTLFSEAYLAEDQDFVDCILDGREPKATGRDGRMAVAVVEAGNRSVRDRVPVRVEGTSP